MSDLLIFFEDFLLKLSFEVFFLLDAERETSPSSSKTVGALTTNTLLLLFEEVGLFYESIYLAFRVFERSGKTFFCFIKVFGLFAAARALTSEAFWQVSEWYYPPLEPS